ncbi:MAG: hypothetical protein K2N89_11270 [Lachnospiraceae bacterium]|nr:hypothetical protein [Lachnospiraceae bacterium]
MNLYNENILKEHYDHILAQNKEILLKGGHGDSFLLSPKTDARMAVALLIRVKGEVSEKIAEYLQELKKTEPALYYYPSQDFHITVLDILRGKPNRTIPENIEDYIVCIQECADKIKPFYIDFQGITASNNAVLACGYYEYGLEEIRQSVRKVLLERNLILEERYQTISAHITVARIPQTLEHPEAFLNQIKEEIRFGKMEVDSLELTFHNWYDSKKTKLAEISLQRK